MKKVNWITLIVGLGFMLFATGLILGGYFINKSHSDFMDTAVETEATIVDIKEEVEYDRLDEEYDTEHTVFISYEFDGNSYENVRLSYYTSSMRIGNKVTIYCDPLNPSEFRLKYGLNVVGIILYVVGGVLALGGFIIIICSFAGKSKRAKSV
ncbi:MAG: DUF3592 domain-containing protein [Lachnospiraceae bacterium]|nr:DUF3592 domain-containing protein [Lachnospiraceae bacterium]